MAKVRLDQLLVQRNLVESRERAQRLIMAGEVLVNDRVADKPGMPIAADAAVRIKEPLPYVSRGGLKLAAALDQFPIPVAQVVCADVGASTGGFTDCLLKHGARLVYAVDVGKGQLDWGLRHDARVVVMENVNARYPLNIPQRVDMATIDVSFISVEKVIPSAVNILQKSGYLIVLLKPQFEAQKHEVGRGGVITQPEIRARVLGRFLTWARDKGFYLKGLVSSPIEGASGNREYFVLLGL